MDFSRFTEEFLLPKQSPFAAFREVLPNGILMEMIKIPKGRLLMGSLNTEEGRGQEEGPQHWVTVPSFYLGKYPVTNAEWLAVMGKPPLCCPLNEKFTDDRQPVVGVCWHQAEQFCQELTRVSSKLYRLSYRLPSEAEWEYACRAGSQTRYSFADSEQQLEKYAWYGQSKDIGASHIVGQKQPNAFALHDMHGNVWEWCEDVWHDSYEGASANSSAWLIDGDQTSRVLRGGSWCDPASHCRSAKRRKARADGWNTNIGFRVVCRALPS